MNNQPILGKNYIIWNDWNTLDNNILIEQLEVPQKPEEKKELITIDGRHGYLTRDYNCYNSISYEVQLNLYTREQVDIVKKIFRGSGNLRLSCCPNVTYKATIVNSVAFERVLYEKRTCVLTFELQPLAYVNNVQDIEIVDSMVIRNNYNAESYPYMRVYGTGSGNIYINQHTITITSIDDYVEMDSELEECYKGTTNCNSNMIGDFVVLEEGETEIRFDGYITSITINPRWRTL